MDLREKAANWSEASSSAMALNYGLVSHSQLTKRLLKLYLQLRSEAKMANFWPRIRFSARRISRKSLLMTHLQKAMKY